MTNAKLSWRRKIGITAIIIELLMDIIFIYISIFWMRDIGRTFMGAVPRLTIFAISAYFLLRNVSWVRWIFVGLDGAGSLAALVCLAYFGLTGSAHWIQDVYVCVPAALLWGSIAIAVGIGFKPESSARLTEEHLKTRGMKRGRS